MSERTPLEDLLRTAVAREIVTEAQATALRSLAAESPRVQGGEHPRGFNAVTVAYGVGALLVSFAFAWFLIDRWSRLGPGKILGVALAYAVVCLAVSWWLRRQGFPHASALALTLAVSLTPVIVWAIESLFGWWPPDRSRDPILTYRPAMTARWLVLELATIGVALAALRSVRHVALTYPIAIALWGVSFHLGNAFTSDLGPNLLQPWTALTSGLVVIAVADQLDRWQGRETARGRAPEGDFAFGFWLAGLLTSSIAFGVVWADGGHWRHLLAPIAVALVVLSLYLGRRTILVFGVIGIFGYLAWLAVDVFGNVIDFQLTVASLGILLILATVFLQRRFPALVERVNRDRDPTRRGLPGSNLTSWLPAILAAGLTIAQIPDLDEQRRQREFRERLRILRQHSGSMRPPREGRNPADNARRVPPDSMPADTSR
jgi:hypothetical protein